MCDLVHTWQEWSVIFIGARPRPTAGRGELTMAYSLGLLAFYCLMIAQSAGAGASYLYPWDRAGEA
jgi:hypothetical protein